MKIKEILIYIGIIILILVGGYLKKDQINIIEGNVGHTGGSLDVEKLTLPSCEEKCNNTCTCKQYLWKKGNPEDEEHDCTIINNADQLITDESPLYNEYDVYDRPDRPNYTTRKYYDTLKGSYSKAVAEMNCWGKGLVLSTPQEVKDAGDGSKNLGEGWTTDGIKRITHNVFNTNVNNLNKPKSKAHCSTNPESICNDYLSWKDHHWRDYIPDPRPYWWRPWKNHIKIDWQGNLNNSNVTTNSYAQTKDLCKYACWKRWGNQCKLIEWNKRGKECRTSNVDRPVQPKGNKCSWTVAKTEINPGRNSR